MVATRLELTAVEGQRSMLQIGERVPVVTGATINPRGRLNNYRDQTIGTLLSVLAKASDDGGIAIQLQFEQSELVAAAQAEEDQVVPQSTETLTQNTTIQLRDGHAQHAGTLKSRTGEAYLVVTARLHDEAQGGGAISFRSFFGSTRASRRLSGDRSRGQSARGSFSESNRTGRRSSGGPAGRGRLATADLAERYQRYATALIARLDRNSDGALDAKEQSEASRDYSAADADKDGLVTVKELVDWLPKR